MIIIAQAYTTILLQNEIEVKFNGARITDDSIKVCTNAVMLVKAGTDR